MPKSYLQHHTVVTNQQPRAHEDVPIKLTMPSIIKKRRLKWLRQVMGTPRGDPNTLVYRYSASLFMEEKKNRKPDQIITELREEGRQITGAFWEYGNK